MLPRNITFSWQGPDDVSEYNLYLGKSPENLSLVGSSTTNEITVLNLDQGTTYYWTVTTDNSSKTSFSEIWFFETKKDLLTATFACSKYYSTTEEEVLFEVEYSSPYDLYKVMWDFDGDGNIDEINSATRILHKYYESGIYRAKVFVIDKGDNSSEAEAEVTVVNKAVEDYANIIFNLDINSNIDRQVSLSNESSPFIQPYYLNIPTQDLSVEFGEPATLSEYEYQPVVLKDRSGNSLGLTIVYASSYLNSVDVSKALFSKNIVEYQSESVNVITIDSTNMALSLISINGRFVGAPDEFKMSILEKALKDPDFPKLVEKVKYDILEQISVFDDPEIPVLIEKIMQKYSSLFQQPENASKLFSQNSIALLDADPNKTSNLYPPLISSCASGIKIWNGYLCNWGYAIFDLETGEMIYPKNIIDYIPQRNWEWFQLPPGPAKEVEPKEIELGSTNRFAIVLNKKIFGAEYEDFEISSMIYLPTIVNYLQIFWDTLNLVCKIKFGDDFIEKFIDELSKAPEQAKK